MSTLRYEKKDKLAYITLDRAEKGNALSPDLLEDLEKVWVDFRDDPAVWIAILTGTGRFFCGGADISRFAGGQTRAATLAIDPPSMMTTSPALRSNPTRFSIFKPIIAAINGYCLGAGMWLALGCDIRLAVETAEFGLPEPRVGVPTTVAAVLPRFMSHTMAYELCLLAERISAQRAYEAGLVNRVVRPDELMTAAEAMAHKLCEKSPLAVRAMKEVLQRCQDMTFADALAYSQAAFATARESDDAKEGARAFMEKRPPEWKCR
jgi:enoyl-CoA hydratase/carnithine racemase